MIKPCIIGLGYVGLPLSATIAKAGFQVTGIDLSKEKVNQVKDFYNNIKMSFLIILKLLIKIPFLIAIKFLIEITFSHFF